MVLWIKFYWNTATFAACLCSTTGKLKNYNRDSIAHKAYNIFCLDPCKKKKKFVDSYSKGTEDQRAQWWKHNASQWRWKSRGVTGEERNTEGMLRGGVGEAGVQRGMRGGTERGAGQPGHPRGRSDLRRQHSPSLEIISRNLQTWMQILVCIKQFLKFLFSFVCPDGPESPERRC